jgi:Sec-independent protein secretion pathway component TatC
VVLSQIMFAIGIGFAYLIIPQGLRILLFLGGDRIEPRCCRPTSTCRSS